MSKYLTQSEKESLDRRVENIALNNMVGYEFDMMDYLLEKAFVRQELLAKTEEV